jgi:cytochrome bd-type quinol oxidase subunit 1
MGKLRIMVLVVSIMPMILSSIVYLLLKNERFAKTFFGDETVKQKVWLPWLLITVGWFLVSVVVSLVFDL